MVWMVVVVVAVVAVVLGVVLARLGRRASTDEAHSVERYHDALGTIETITHRTERPAIRVLGRPGEDDGQPSPPPDLVAGAPSPANGAGSPLVFDDARPAGAPPAPPVEVSGDGFRSERARRTALSTMNHRSRSVTPYVAAAVAVAVIAGLAALGAHAGSRKAARPAATSRPATSRPTATTTTAPTTTIPTQLVATTSTVQSGTYPVGSPTYQVTVTTTSGPSWVQATSAGSGTVLFAATIPPGQTQVIPASGTVSVLIGAPATLQVDGVPVVMPTGSRTPFTATFAASPAAGTGTTTTTTAPAGTAVGG